MKKILSVLLTLTMVFTLVPNMSVNVKAEEEPLTIRDLDDLIGDNKYFDANNGVIVDRKANSLTFVWFYHTSIMTNYDDFERTDVVEGFDYCFKHIRSEYEFLRFKVSNDKVVKIEYIDNQKHIDYILELMETSTLRDFSDLLAATKGTYAFEMNGTVLDTIVGDGSSLISDLVFGNILENAYVYRQSNGNYLIEVISGEYMDLLLVEMDDSKASKISHPLGYEYNRITNHTHTWAYAADDAVLYAYCTETEGSDDCDYQRSEDDLTNAVTLTLNANDSIGSAKKAKLIDDLNVEISKSENKWKTAGLIIPVIKYYDENEEPIEFDNLTVGASYYIAKAILKDAEGNELASVSKRFHIVDTPKIVKEDSEDLLVSSEKAVATYTVKATEDSTIHIVGLNLNGIHKNGDDYDGVYVTCNGNKLIEDNQYKLSEGSIKVNLKKAYLDTLPVGENAIKVYVKESGTASANDFDYSFDATITIKAKPAPAPTPEPETPSSSPRPRYRAPNTGVTGAMAAASTNGLIEIGALALGSVIGLISTKKKKED